jgi:hypothetical protein
MLLFRRKTQDNQSELAADLRVREERLRRLEVTTESELARREKELAEREAIVRREEARVRQWAGQMADAAAHLKSLFARCDRLGIHHGATVTEELAAQAIEALRPGKAAPEIRESSKTRLRAGQLEVPSEFEEESPSDAAFFRPPSSDGGSGLVIRMPGILDDKPLPHLSSESVLRADMRRLQLLPDEDESSLAMLANLMKAAC